jgi:hypothetical protein
MSGDAATAAGIGSGQMGGTEETGRDQPETAQASLDLDALAVSDRFRLFNFTRRDDHLAYLWVLCALERLRAVHHVQAHTEDVAQGLADRTCVRRSLPGSATSGSRRAEAVRVFARPVGLANHEKHSPANPLSERDSRKEFY